MFRRLVTALGNVLVGAVGIRPFARSLYHVFVDGWGADYVDVDQTMRNIREVGEVPWARGWEQTARRYLDLARRLDEQQRRLSAAALYKRAALYFRIADLGINSDTPLKRALYRSCADAYARYAMLHEPPLQRLDVAYDGRSLAGYLHVPPGGGKLPCVIIVPGLGSSKEQPDFQPETLTARGFAAFHMDLPGHGETFPGMLLELTSYQAVSAAFDALAAHPSVDGRRIALLGTSLGGTVALKTASEDHRFHAVVNISGFYEPRDWFETSAPFVEAALRHVTGIGEATAVRELVAGFTLRGAVARITCPLLSVHGEQDVLIPVQEARRIYDEAVGPKMLIIYPGGDHGLCNTREARYDVLDWLAAHLDQQASQPVALVG